MFICIYIYMYMNIYEFSTSMRSCGRQGLPAGAKQPYFSAKKPYLIVKEPYLTAKARWHGLPAQKIIHMSHHHTYVTSSYI